MLKAILFDLGDTLFDFRPMDTRAVFEQSGRLAYEYLEKHGCAPLPSFRTFYRRQHRAVWWSYIWSKLRGREFNSFDLLGRLCRGMGLSLDDAAMRELAWEWYRIITTYSDVEPSAIPVLARFRERGLKLAIVSNTFIPGFVLDRHMEMHGLLEFFPVRIYSSEVGYRKPHQRIFQMALDAVGVSPAEAVFVGDVIKKDVVGAQRAGMVAILRQPFANSRTHRVADHVIRQLTDLEQLLPIFNAPEPVAMPSAEPQMA